jgi:hypothetical protein
MGWLCLGSHTSCRSRLVLSRASCRETTCNTNALIKNVAWDRRRDRRCQHRTTNSSTPEYFLTISFSGWYKQTATRAPGDCSFLQVRYILALIEASRLGFQIDAVSVGDTIEHFFCVSLLLRNVVHESLDSLQAVGFFFEPYSSPCIDPDSFAGVVRGCCREHSVTHR